MSQPRAFLAGVSVAKFAGNPEKPAERHRRIEIVFQGQDNRIVADRLHRIPIIRRNCVRQQTLQT